MAMDLSAIVNGVVIEKAFSVSEDNESTDNAKKATLRLTFEGCSLRDVFQSVASTEVIKLQGKLRKKFASFTSGHVFEVTFKAVTRISVDPMDELIARANAAGMDPIAYFEAEKARRAALKSQVAGS